MPTPEQIREATRRRKANQRARERGLPEPYPLHRRGRPRKHPIEPGEQKDEVKSAREKAHFEDLAWAKELDATGRFYKSECRSAISLLAIYEGNNNVTLEDPEIIDSKTGNRKQNIPNPSRQAIRIRAIEKEENGEIIKIDPDMLEYKNVFEVDRRVTFKEWLDLRDKGRRNLFWLSNVLGKRLFHKSHQIICDMFVQKNFDGLYFPGFERSDLAEMIRRQVRVAKDGTPLEMSLRKEPFPNEGSPTRTLMLFAPRGGWKSTIDGIDAVQWMLNAPDIRIMIITAFRALAKTFLGEIKRYFYLPSRGTPTAFHLLYPEYILTGVDGRSGEPIRCPAATMDSKEPHLWITSMESSATGMRCDIRKADDIVDPKNSNSLELREELAFKFNGTNDLVEPWGFTDIIGTRYYTDDYYGTRMEPDDDGLVAPYSYLCIPAWYPKPEFREKYEGLLSLPNGMSQVTEDMVNLWFPSKLNFQVLRTILLNKKERNSSNLQKERSFRNQQLNIATDATEVSDMVVHFTRDVLRAHTYASSAAPLTGEKIVTIDWAYSENRTSDYSVLSSVLRHIREDKTEELVVLEVEYDKWKSSQLAERIVLFLRKHQPSRTLIERALGADLLEMAIRAYAVRYDCLSILNTIRWVSVDNSLNAKANRIKTLEILLSDDRLHFVAGPWIDELYRQFERFTGETRKGRKDDIPDCISLASRTLPPSMFTTIKNDPEVERRAQEESDRKFLKEQYYKRIFGQQSKPLSPPLVTSNPEPQQLDPRMKIFGNKGPWRL